MTPLYIVADCTFSWCEFESVHQSQVFSVLLLAFLSIVNGWADRFGRRGDQRVKRISFRSATPSEAGFCI
jgi:hypothetical protein